MRGAAAVLVTVLAVAATADGAGRADPGSPRSSRIWWLPRTAPPGSIAGYATSVSVAAGSALGLHVATSPSQRYSLVVYRLGWYGGRGARLMHCLPPCVGGRLGAPRPTPPVDPRSGEVAARWPVTDVVRVGATWPSGYYEAELILEGGPARGEAAIVPFVVRPRRSRGPARILIVAPVDTWQAYNTWGGKSLYTSLSGNPKAYARSVSFDRPYDSFTSRYDLYWEYPLVRFLERSGFRADYATDVDLDAEPTMLKRYRLVIVPGHSEYWTKNMRDAFDAARDSGVNLAFLGGNDGYWQARYADDRRSLVEYRNGSADPDSDPTQKTIRFRDLSSPRPECELLGVEWQGGWTDSLSHADTVTAAAASSRWAAGTGLRSGDSLAGAVGYEWDAAEPDCAVPALEVLFRYAAPSAGDGAPFERSFRSGGSDATVYSAPSGSTVFSAGSIQFSWTLDDFAAQLDAPYPAADVTPVDPRLQRFMSNLIRDLSTA